MRRRRNSLSLIALAGMAHSCAAISSPQPIALPQLNFDRLGDIILAGDFMGISLLDYAGRETVLQTPTPKEKLIIQSGNDTYVSSEFADGVVSASCMLHDNQSAIIAGNFSKILNETVNGIAKLDLQKMTVTSLGPQAPRGPINALWCNGSDVYVGGAFEFGASYGVAVWNSVNSTWSNPPFEGFVNGSSVNAIVPVGDNIVFGGTMKGLAPAKGGNSTKTNDTELLDPGMQPVSFNFANATGFGSQSSSGVSVPDLLCPYSDNDDSNGWTADLDSTTGYVNITLGAGSVLPTRMRLFNLPDGNGTKTFRLVTSPADGIMNLSYTDASGNLQSCSAFCPLPEKNSTVEYQDFELVNVVPTSSLRIELLDYYGTHAGLKGIQLFQEGQYAYANNEFNMPRACGSVGGDSEMQGSQTATAALQGSWTTISDYMMANITDKSDFESTSAKLLPTFNDYTVNRGQYALQLWTPGCTQDNSCSQRGQVNVSVYPGFGSPQSTILYQTNNFAKYDLVYNGTLQDGAYIQISPTTQNQLPMQLVAYKASLIYVGPPSDGNASVIFEYSPANFSSNSSLPVGNTVLNTLGQQLGNNASVNALLVNGTTNLLIGGSNFAPNVSASLLSYSLAGSKNVSGIGISEGVSKLYSAGGDTFALSSNQSYVLNKNASLSSLEIGTSTNAAPLNLNGTSYVAFSHDDDSAGLSLWEPGRGLAPRQVTGKVHGHLEATYNLGNATAYLGSLEITDTATFGGGARLSVNNPTEPSSLPLSFSTPHETVSRAAAHQTRDDGSSTSEDNEFSAVSSIYTGVYINSTHSIVAGHFNATLSNNRSVTNAVMLSGDNASPLVLAPGDSIDANSSFITAASVNGTVALGGNVTGKVNSTDVRGLILYNASAQAPLATQAPALSDNMFVSSLVFRPNSSELMVGGEFANSAKNANSSCDGLCGYDLDSKTWYGPASLDLGTSAVVNDLVFETGNRLVIGGNFKTGKGETLSQVAVYDFSNNTLETLSQLPGPVKSLVVLSNATQDPMYAVSGVMSTKGQQNVPYVRWYNGTSQTWHEFEGISLQNNTVVSGLSLVTLQNRTRSNGPLTGNQGLFISGQLRLPNAIQASVAVYDGQRLQGLYATSPDALSPDSSPGESSGAGIGLVSAIYSQYGGNLKGGVSFVEGTSRPHPKPSPGPQPSGGNTLREGHLMPVGHVVGVACGIGIGCVMVLTLLYFLVEFLFRMGSERVPYQNLAQTRPGSDPMAGTKVL